MVIEKAEAIARYIRAKDGNRPHLLNEVFSNTAILRMDVRSGTISFPGESNGRDAIAEVLVRQFNRTYENVYMICVGPEPRIETDFYRCGWMVVMSEKEDQSLRVGCGHYFWQFDDSGKVRSLVITIEVMESASSEFLSPAIAWVSNLSYPWCELTTFSDALPDVAEVEYVVQRLREGEGESRHP